MSLFILSDVLLKSPDFCPKRHSSAVALEVANVTFGDLDLGDLGGTISWDGSEVAEPWMCGGGCGWFFEEIIHV